MSNPAGARSKSESIAFDAGVGYLAGLQKDGFWGYLPGRDWSVEVSIWAALACRKHSGCLNAFLQRLLAEQNHDGGWSNEPARLESDWSTAAALFALNFLARIAEPERLSFKVSTESIDSACRRATGWLLDKRAEHFNFAVKFALLFFKGAEFDYDRGWPWTPETFDWVGPTSYAVLALKNGRGQEKLRIRRSLASAEEYLLKLVCHDGGWNFGDRYAFGELSPPDAQSTALALLALCNRAEQAGVRKSLNWLSEKNVCTTAWSKAWTAFALSCFAVDSHKFSSELLAGQKADGCFSENLLTQAVTCLSLESSKSRLILS